MASNALLPLSLNQIDSRSGPDIYLQALALAKIYCRDWYNVHADDLDESDLGIVLLKLFGQLGNTVGRGVNRLPQKHLLSFYQFLGLDVLPPKPAQALLSFTLKDNVDEEVNIPAGTQVASSKNQKVIFETTDALNATNIPMAGAYSVDPDGDSYVDLSSIVLGKQKAFSLFSPSDEYNGNNATLKPIYLSHQMYFASNLFNYQTPANMVLTLTFEQPPNALLQDKTLWQWFVFDEKGNEILLTLTDTLNHSDGGVVANPLWNKEKLTVSFNALTFSQIKMADNDECWLGWRLIPGSLKSLSQQQQQQLKQLKHETGNTDSTSSGFPEKHLVGNEAPIMSKIVDMRFDLSADNLPWDGLFVNDTQVSAKKGFYIFGKNPAVNDVFYLASMEAFKPGFEVTLAMDFNPGVKSDDLVLSWEYWNGTKWQSFSPDTPFESFESGEWKPIKPLDFSVPPSSKENESTENPSAQSMSVRFLCPDIVPSKLNELTSRWIRVKIVKGNYGDRYSLTPLDLQEQEQLQLALKETLDTLAKNWTADVLPDKSNFQLAALMALGNFAAKSEGVLEGVIKGIFGGALSILTGGAITKIAEGLAKEEVGALFNIEKEVTVEGQDKIIYYSGLDKITPSLDENMLKYLGKTLNWENLWQYLSDQEWVVGSKKNCVAPHMNALRLSYAKNQAPMDSVCSDNNFAIQNLQVKKNGQFTPFYPFYLITGLPAFYLGFKGSVRGELWTAWFSFSVPSPSAESLNSSHFAIHYEYMNQDRVWKKLDLETDQTKGLSQSGMITWRIPTDAGQYLLFNQDAPCYWTRIGLSRVTAQVQVPEQGEKHKPENSTEAVNKNELPPEQENNQEPSTKAVGQEVGDAQSTYAQVTYAQVTYAQVTMNGIYPNSVWAKNYTTHTNQVLGTSNETANQSFQITPFLVYPGQQIDVREASYPSPDQERIIMLESGPDAIRTEQGSDGKEIWVRWHAVPSLRLSGPKSRHYTIDHQNGTIRFGDGTQGMIPPGLKNNIVAAFYYQGDDSTVLPSPGELSKSLKQLHNVASVTNYEEAFGKQQQESQQQLLARIPDTLKTGNRAVTLSDFEFMAVQSSNLVTRAKCYQKHNAPHQIEVIIVPSSDYGSYYPGAELSEKVRSYLQQWSLPILENKIAIRAPDYTKIYVSLSLSIEQSYTPTAVKAALETRLNQFFDPVLGQSKGQGWEFGAVIFASQVSSEILNVAGVDKIRRLHLSTTAPATASEGPNVEKSVEKSAEKSIDKNTSAASDAQNIAKPNNPAPQMFGQIQLDSTALPLPGIFSIDIVKDQYFEVDYAN